MGEYRFRLPADWSLETRQANSIHVVGIDGIPWPCRIFVEGNTLVVNRNRDESGRIYISFPFPDFGEFTVCTGTLPERPEQYHLLTELARGTLNRLRNHTSIWFESGFDVQDSIYEKTRRATRLLGQSILGSDFEIKDQTARDSLALAMDALFELSHQFGTDVAKRRVENTRDFPMFWFAHRATVGDDFEKSVRQLNFELVQIDPQYVQHAMIRTWTEQNISKRLIVGPILDASPGGMPQELLELDDFEARRNKMISNTRSFVEHMPKATSLIHVASGLNGLGHRQLGYPQQLQMTSDIFSVLEESSLEVPMMVSFEFPWAERLASSVGGIHPLQIADTLLRQGARISFLGLDINLDYWPMGSVARDPLQWIDLIEIWSQLGLPLILCLRVPTGDQTPSLNAPEKLVNQVRQNLNDEQRLNLLREILPLMISRPVVHGVILSQWSNESNPKFPAGGLVDKEGAAKEIVGVIDDIRRQHLNHK